MKTYLVGSLARRCFLLTAIAFTTISLTGSTLAEDPQPLDKNSRRNEQPNILFIFADDLSYDSIAATGNSEIKTPNIDSIAKSGMTFSHAYNMGSWSGAVCVASRTMLNSGRFVWDAKTLNLQQEQQAGRTWAQMMHNSGYETYFAGKWHIGLKPANLFDHVGAVRPGMPNQTPEGYNRPADGNDWTPWDESKGGFWKGGKHWSEALGDEAVGFLQDAKDREKPFFMYIAFNAPHDPRQSPKSFVDMYPVDQIKVPADFLAEYPYKDEIGCGPGLRDEKLAPFPRTREAVQVNRQEYYAIITHMDQQIGRILKALEESGKSDSTYVIFTADHGLACGHHGLMGKQNMYDHSVRVPFFLKGPDIKAGSSSDASIYLQDAMATSLDLAGATATDHVAFRSLMPIVRGESKTQYDSIYGGYLQLQRMVTQDHWKLILYPQANVHRLYDLKTDPNEMQDLSNHPEHQKRVQELFAEFQRLQTVTNDPLAIERPKQP